MKKIIVADDHPVFLFGLKSIINKEEDFNVEYMLNNGDEALERIQSINPDLAILGVDLPNLNGLEITRRVKDLNLKTKIIVLTNYKDEAIYNLALDCGAKGYVLKEDVSEEIIRGINAVFEGGFFTSSSIHIFYTNRIINIHMTLINTIKSLTKSESKILKLIANNLSSNQIAETLFVSVKTVQNHRFNLCRKLNLNGVNSLLTFALQKKHLIHLYFTESVNN